jgi:diadenosine tetraphosphate (Ap4A) HIT family hydrolase
MHIYQTKNFIVESFETPHVDRDDGGHIKIYPKIDITDRSEMSLSVATEYIRLTMIVGKAMTNALNNQGLEIMRINYQDMGNWAFKKGQKPKFHVHIYGRAKKAKHQPYTEAVYLPDRSTGFYDNFKPLAEEDVQEIRKEIEKIIQEEKYINMQQLIDEQYAK